MNSTINRAHQHSTTVPRDTGTVERGFFTIGSRAIHPVCGLHGHDRAHPGNEDGK